MALPGPIRTRLRMEAQVSPTLRRSRTLGALRELGVEISFAWPRFRSAFPYDWEVEGL